MTPETPGTASKEKTAPKLVKLNTARKLAESWVNNMTGSPGDEVEEKEPEARPARLGLGARVAPQSRLGPSSDPAGKSLHAKLEAGKKRAAATKLEEESKPTNGQASDDDDEEPESRTSAFTKKIVVPVSSSFQGKNQGKKKRRR